MEGDKRMAVKKDKSIKIRLYVAVVLSAILLYALTIIVGNIIHSSSVENRYKNLCKSVVETTNGLMSSEKMDLYINDHNSYEYIQLDKKIDALKATIPGVNMIGIYIMEAEGMKTVFSTESFGEENKKLVNYDSQWGRYRDSFLNNQIIENAHITTRNGISVAYCLPLFPEEGYRVYLCAGVLKDRIDEENSVFLKRNLIALAAVMVVILIGLLMLIELKIVRPMKKIGKIVWQAAACENSEFIEELRDNYIKSGNEIENIYHSLINIYTQKARLAGCVDSADGESIDSVVWLIQRMDVLNSDHLDNFLEYIMLFLAEMKEKNEYSDEVTRSMYGNILLAAPLHDVGKLVIPEEIVNKPGKLTDEEFEIMKRHCEYGAAIISDMYASHQSEGYLEYAREMALHHHEKWDGTGYPHGLKGEEIPLYVRIVTIATVFDTLVSERPYSRAFSFREAMKVLVSEKGKLFDPVLVDIFIKSKRKFYNIYEKNKESKQ